MNTPRTTPLLLALLAACSDYGVAVNDDGGDYGGGCADRSYDGEDVPTDQSCYHEEQRGDIHNVIEWMVEDWDGSPGGNDYVSMTPVVAPLDGDGVPDVAVVAWTADTGVLRVMSGAGGAAILEVGSASLEATSGLAAGDLDGDGSVELVGVTLERRVVAFRADGSTMWSSADLGDAVAGEADQPAIADLDEDGSPEVIAGSAILDASGAVVGLGAYGRGSGGLGTAPCAADLDGDGRQEVVAGNAVYSRDGTALWANGEDDGYPALADFDGDGEAEIVVSSRGELRLQDTDGSVLWTLDLGDGDTSGPPAVGDLDGDQQPEVVVGTRKALHAVDTGGRQMWRIPVDASGSGYATPVIFDFERDGVPEVIFGDEERLRLVTGSDGLERLASPEYSNREGLQEPVMADVDGDGQVEIVTGNTPSGSGANSGVHVFGAIDTTWPPGRGIWNQHAWSITNVEDDGTIPASPEANWATFNSFRAGDVNPTTGLLSPDLWVRLDEVCLAQCPRGSVVVWGQVGNQGLGNVRGTVELELYAVTLEGWKLVATRDVEGGVPAGKLLDSFQWEVDGLDGLDFSDLVLAVDGGNDQPSGGIWLECDESNNVDRWGGEVCP